MRRTTRCRHFLMLCTLVVGSAPAAVAAGQQCSISSYFSPLGTTVKIDFFDSQSPVVHPKDLDPARSQVRPMDCTYSNYQYQSNSYGESSYISCEDAAAKVAEDGDLDAQTGCCNLGGSVWWESSVQRSNCLHQDPPPPPNGIYSLSGYIFYKCKFCLPPSC
jgi:hypothetical protein